MKPVPPQVEPTFLPGIALEKRGKVCELYDIPGWPVLRLKVISDRASVHDIILPFHIPGKGKVLNFIDDWWRRQMPHIEHDVAALGPEIDAYLPQHLRDNPDLHQRARVIKAHQALEVELIYRWLLTGTGLTQYKEKNGFVCGQKLPDGLREWDELNPSVATPTTKDEEGHDEAMDLSECIARFGLKTIALTYPLFEMGRKKAADRGVIIADTKFEVGKDLLDGELDGELVLIDEALTPDSSRYLTPEAVAEARRTGAKPPSYDKQPIRDYVWKYLGVGPKTPLTEEVIAKVHGHTYPSDLIAETAARYEQLLKILTGMNRDEYAATL